MARSRVEKCPARAVTSSTRGWGWSAGTSLVKWRRVENGVEMATSSRTASSSPPTVTDAMPQGGRSWVSRERSIIS